MALLSSVGEKWGSSQDERHLSSCTFHFLLCSPIVFSNEASKFYSEISKTVSCQHISIFVLFSASPKHSDLLRTACGHTVPKSVKTRWNFQNKVFNSVYINKDALLGCFDIIQNENGWDVISIRESVGLARLLNDEIFLYFLSFSIHFSCMWTFCTTPCKKVPSSAASVHKAIQHFEVAINDIGVNLPPVNGNSEPSTKRVRKDHNINSEANEACDIIVIQMKYHFEEANHTLPFVLIEP
jgi:hypothetical protein